LLPADDRLQVPGRARELSPSQLPRFIYSDAYEVFKSNVERRSAILRLGADAFRDVVSSGSSDEPVIEAAGDAFAGGHLRFVSFDEREQAILDGLGITGELGDDVVHVAAQNWGGGIPGQGSKMDYWIERDVSQRCRVEDDGSAECETTITFANVAPRGLIPYVAGRPYAVARDNVETFLPGGAQVHGVYRDGAPAESATDQYEGTTVVEVYVSVPHAKSRTITIDYALPPDASGYTLRVTPQPLARDATLALELGLPHDWAVDGPGARDDDGVWRYDGRLDGAVELRATPDQRTGLPGIWDSLSDFWTQPVFGD
jgi:hypothetical protein